MHTLHCAHAKHSLSNLTAALAKTNGQVRKQKCIKRCVQAVTITFDKKDFSTRAQQVSVEGFRYLIDVSQHIEIPRVCDASLPLHTAYQEKRAQGKRERKLKFVCANYKDAVRARTDKRCEKGSYDCPMQMKLRLIN